MFTLRRQPAGRLRETKLRLSVARTERREKKGNRWYVSVNVSLEKKAIEGGQEQGEMNSDSCMRNDRTGDKKA
jgi:hypothetical protein